MSRPQITELRKLDWPVARPRTADRQNALWKHEGGRVPYGVALRRLHNQCLMTTRPGQDWRIVEMILTRGPSLPGGRPPTDPGAAFYFEFDGRPHVLACDKWARLADNVSAIAAHIEALRGQERWGVADLAQAFAGHVALPAPEQWWQILGVASSADSAAIDAAWRARMRDAHPDRGGTDAAAARLNAARDQGKRTNG